MSQILRQSTQVIVVIGPFVDVTDGFTPETGVTLSGADEAELLKGNSSSTTDISGATFAAITGCDGWYALTLTTSLTDTVGALTIMVNDDSVCLPVFARYQVIPQAAYDAMYATGANPALEPTLTLIRAQLPASLVGGRMDSHVGSIADGVISLTKFTQNYFDAVASYVWASSVGFFAGVSDSFGSAIADLWNRVDVNVSTRASDTALEAVQSDTNDIQTRLPAALISGRIDATVGAMQNDVLTAAATAADFSTEINTGMATTAELGVIAQGIDSILTRLPADLINGRMDSHVGSIANDTISFGKFTQSYWDGVSTYVWTASVGQYGTVSDSFGESINSIRNEMENVAGEVWDVQLSAHLNSGSTGAALNAAGAAGDPWSTALPGAYGAGTAGFIVGTNLDATVSSRLASASYTAPDNASIAAIGAIVTSISARIPTSLVGGRIDAHVGSVADGVFTFNKFAQGFWDGVSSYVWSVSVGQYAGVSDSFGSYLNDMRNELENIAEEVWDVVLSEHLVAGSTGSALNAAGAAGDPWSTALPGVYGAGTAGNILGNRLDVAVSSRLASASYTAPDNASIAAIGVIVASISARIPAVLVNGRIDAYVGEVAPGVLTFDKFAQNYWDGISTYVWTVSVGQFAGVSDSFAHAVAEVWSKAGAYLDVAISTRLAAASYIAPDNSSIATIASRVDVAMSTRLASASYTAPDNASITAVKAKTDQLTFTVANQVDSNIESVNGTIITGAGTPANPWGP